MFEEFKKFAMRGNVIDLAVGVIIGASFTGIVTSLVNDVIMPPIGLALGGVDFSNFFVVLKGDRAVDTLAAAKAAKDVTINYGLFVNAVINFLIVAFVLFLLIRQMNKLVAPKPAEAAPPPPERCAAAARDPRFPERPGMKAMKAAGLRALCCLAASPACAAGRRARRRPTVFIPPMWAAARFRRRHSRRGARARLQPLLTPRLNKALAMPPPPKPAFAAKNKDSPPLIEGDIFSSLFEGPTA